MTVPDRGDIVIFDFNPQVGREQAGRRPAIVLSTQAFNTATQLVVICPITNQEKGYPFEVKLPMGMQVTGVVLTDQVKALDWNGRGIRIVEKAPQGTIQDCIDRVIAIFE